MHLNSGALLQGGKYRIESVLGQGGFGITYVAEQVGLGRKVAVKEFFMKDLCNRDTDTSYVSVPSVGCRELVDRFRAKFVKEARMIAAMEDSHIIRIHDVFEENGTAYYVMEYLPGGSLKDSIPAGGFPESEALGYVRQIAYALRYIHEEKHVLHLDVKPSNVLVRKNGEVVLIDFGISKHYDDDGGEQTSSSPVGVSRGYAPLEQYNAGGVSQFSPATDIYSLGAVLYALLTGQTPPDANSVFNNGLPELPAKVSRNVKAAMNAAMQPRRTDRPQSVKEFLQMLDGPAQRQPQPQPVQPQPKSSQPASSSGTFDEQYGKLCMGKQYVEAFSFCLEHIGEVPDASDKAMAAIEKYYKTNVEILLPVPEYVSYEWLMSLFKSKGYNASIEKGVLSIGGSAKAEITTDGNNKSVKVDGETLRGCIGYLCGIAMMFAGVCCVYMFFTWNSYHYDLLLYSFLLFCLGCILVNWGTSRVPKAGRIIAQALVEEKKKGKTADTDETVL